MAITNNPNVAQCVPSTILRERITNDLGLKGVVTLPDKVDLEAIRVVYSFNASPPLITRQTILFNQPLFNTLNYNGPIIDPSLQLSVRPTHCYVRSLYVVLRMDAAGRAVLAAANEILSFGLYYQNPIAAPNNPQICQQSWNVMPAPGTAGYYHMGTHHRAVAAINLLWPGPDIFLAELNNPIVSNGCDINLFVNCDGGSLFPANTFLDIRCLWDYEI